MTAYPNPEIVAEMATWCKRHRGSVIGIAALVKRRNGTTGVHHSAVHRTLQGRERNSLVIAAFRAYAGPRWQADLTEPQLTEPQPQLD